MRLLITGVCGFVGSTLARELLAQDSGCTVFGIDNFIRPGSESNRADLKSRGVRLVHGDLRNPSDLEALPQVDFVIDAAANPSVLAGVDGRSSSRQLVEHNLGGTLNLLEWCKAHKAGLILLSTSRVYSIPPLANLKVEAVNGAFRPSESSELPKGLTHAGVQESFSTQAPLSLYGATKLASEAMALEYGETFNFPVFINRCGVLAGAGQFGRPDQGIFAYWINSYLRKRPLRYIGFDGQGHQVRDCLHPRDLASLLLKQMGSVGRPVAERVINCSGGENSARSLRQISEWCFQRYGGHTITSDMQPRLFDIPWLILDSSKANTLWQWQPSISVDSIMTEIAEHAEGNPGWLDLSAPI